MVSITVSLSPEFKTRLAKFSWVNWSEAGREELIKREIFNRFLKTGKITDEDWDFCEQVDWHPVDELPLKESFVKKLEKARKETPVRFNSVDEFFESIK